jgi:hypothetical protein
MRETKSAYKVLDGRPERKRPLRRRRLEDNTEMDLRKTEKEGVS